MRAMKVYGIVTGVCFLLWWWSFLLFFPLENLRDAYSVIILDRMWIPVNMLEVVGVITYAGFFLEYSNAVYRKTKTAALFKLLFLIGIAGLCGFAFYETFLWPIIAANAPQVLDIVSGPIYTSPLFNGASIAAILSYWAGCIYLGISAWKRGRIISLVYTIGVSLHCLGYLAGPLRYVVQSVGYTLFTAGLAGLAIVMAKGMEKPAKAVKIPAHA